MEMLIKPTPIEKRERFTRRKFAGSDGTIPRRLRAAGHQRGLIRPAQQRAQDLLGTGSVRWKLRAGLLNSCSYEGGTYVGVICTYGRFKGNSNTDSALFSGQAFHVKQDQRCCWAIWHLLALAECD